METATVILLCFVLLAAGRLQNEHGAQIETNQPEPYLGILMEQMANIQRKMIDMENENQQLQKHIVESGQINHKLAREIQSLKEDNIKLQSSIGQRNQNVAFVSFTAFAAEDKYYENEELVLFDVEKRNYGSAYNSELSIFECPLDGYYSFFISVYSEPNQRMHAGIHIDGEGILAEAESAGGVWNSASTMGVTYCEAGQLVWVKCKRDGSMMRGLLSYFTGTLLYTV